MNNVYAERAFLAVCGAIILLGMVMFREIRILTIICGTFAAIGCIAGYIMRKATERRKTT